MEGGLKWRHRRWAASAAAYRLSLADLIERVRSTYRGAAMYEGQQVYVRENVGTAYVRGIELDGDIEPWPDVRVSGWLTQTYGQQVSRGEPMRRIPPVHGLVGLSWTPARARHWVELRWRFAGRQDRLASGDRDDHRIDSTGTAAWRTVAVSGGWRVRSGVDLVGGIDNARDEGYRLHGSGIDAPGRTWWLGTHVRLW